MPIKDEDGLLKGYAAEIHDVAVSKLMASREKDYEFLRDCFQGTFLRAEVLAERIETLAYQEYRAALRPRTEKLARTLENAGLRQDAAIFRGWLRP